MPDDELFPVKDKNKAKRTPRRWSVIIIEVLLVLAAVIVIFRLVSTGPVAPSLDAAKQYEWGMVYQKNGEPEKALEAFTAAINQGYTPLGRAYFERGRVQYDLGNYSESVADYTHSIALTPDCDDCYVDYKNRGVAYWMLEDYDAAIRDFTQAIEINPRYLAAYVSRAHLTTLQGNNTQALADMKLGLERSAGKIVERGLANGQQRSVQLDSVGQQYHFTFSAVVGDDVTLVIPRSNLDVVLMLQDKEGTPLAYDDSEGIQGGDSLNYLIEKTGDYTLVIAAYLPASEGDMTLMMTSINPDETSFVSDAPRIDLENVDRLTVADTLKNQSISERAVASSGMIFIEKALEQIIVYDLRDETIGYNALDVGGDHTWAVAVSADGELVAVGKDKTLILYDAVTGSVQQTLRLGDAYPSAMAFSPDSTTIAVVVFDEVRLYDALSGSRLHTLAMEPIYGKSLAFSRDGQWLAVGQDKGLIHIWDIEARRLVRTLETGKVEEVLALAFSPNANLIAVGGEARRVQVWDLSSGELLQTYTDHTRKITDLAFSPNGNLLASASQDQTVRLWDIDAPDSVQTLQHEGSVEVIEFQPDGRTLLTSADDYKLRFWRVKE